jgi:hypothetical protein
MNKRTILAVLLALSLLTACSMPQPTQALLFTPTPPFVGSPAAPLPTFVSSAVAFPSPTLPYPTLVPTGVFVTAPVPSLAPVVVTSAPVANQPAPDAFCADPQATELINKLKTALQNSDGELFASLVSPAHGMEVRYYRTGRTVVYDQAHAKFLFESDFQVNWGDAPGSGLPTIGPFHETVLPAMMKVFGTDSTLACNKLQVGGTTYDAKWPYPGVNYYSLYFPGTAANGNMDWHTWVIGMEYVGGKPYIHSMMQFEWEI